MSERREMLLRGLSLGNGIGLEIGPLCRPLVRREHGRILYVDHVSTEELRAKYGSDPNVAVDEIVDVDVVWGGASGLREAVGFEVDYVIASHVLEHVPDLISWLEEICRVLKPSGEVRLMIPDRRYTFDRLRRETRVEDLLYARMVRARMPLPHIVLDHVLNLAKVDGCAVWRGELDDRALERHHTLDDAMGVAAAAAAGQYHDVHSWVFTPRSLALLFAQLVEHQAIQFECSGFQDTGENTMEFFVAMRPCRDVESAALTWRNMADACAGPAAAAAIVLAGSQPPAAVCSTSMLPVMPNSSCSGWVQTTS